MFRVRPPGRERGKLHGYDAPLEDAMRGTNRAKELKRRASQRRATHKARRAALTLKAETRVPAVKEEKDRKKIGSKGPVKPTAKAGKAAKR
jgi:hypothetical protein